MRVLLFGVVALAGCYKPEIDGCNITCAPDGEQCPDGMTCNTAINKCRPAGSDTCDGGPPPLANAISISTGGQHACAIDRDAQLLCWGSNELGQIDGVPGPPVLQPKKVVLPNVSWLAVDAGAFHTCAIGEQDGQDALYCWGDNRNGQCGVEPINEDFEKLAITKVDAIPNPKRVSTGLGHTCVLENTGALSCWGLNSAGQIGQDPVLVDHDAAPTQIAGDWEDVSINSENSCAIKTDKTLWCWGNNASIQLGNGASSTPHFMPVPVTIAPSAAEPIESLSVGSDASCVVQGGAIKCWGDNVSGQAGLDPNATNNEIGVPTPIAHGTGAWTAVRMGHEFGCAIDPDGKVLCWGFDDPRLGDNTDALRGADYGPIVQLPVVTGDDDTPGAAVALDAGGYHLGVEDGFACAIFGDASGGNIRCWGANDHGQLGDGTQSLVPVATKISLPGEFTVARVGGRTACAIDTAGQTYCWGDNTQNKVDRDGNNQKVFSVPTLEDVADDATDVAVGSQHVCALTQNASTAKCWGRNTIPVLGISGSTGNERLGTSSLGGTFSAIYASGTVTCVFGSASSNKCWGRSDWFPGTVETPTSQGGLFLTSMSLGPNSACSIGSNTTKCFGSDNNQERGDGQSQAMETDMGTSVVDAAMPPAAIMDFSAVAQMDSTARHRCAISSQDTYCWGANEYGQIGASTGTGTTFFARKIDGNPFLTLPPVTTIGAPGFLDQRIAAGGDFTCAIHAGDQQIHCWGENDVEQCTSASDGKLNPGFHTAIAVDGNAAPMFQSVSSGTGSSCAVDKLGAVYCWGNSKRGECGTGVSDRDFAVAVLAPTP